MKKSIHILSNSIETQYLFREEMCFTAYIQTIKAVSTYLSEDNRQAEHFGTLEYNGYKSTLIKLWGHTVEKENDYWKGMGD